MSALHGLQKLCLLCARAFVHRLGPDFESCSIRFAERHPGAATTGVLGFVSTGDGWD